MNPISISFSISDNFSQHIAVLMTSVLMNNAAAEFVFHILHRNITQDNQKLLSETGKRFGRCKVVFHKIDESIFAAAKLPSVHISQETYYRLLLPKILLDEKRTIYLDADMLVYPGIDELWNEDLEGHACAAVYHCPFPENLWIGASDSFMRKKQGYFNAGMILFNLNFIRCNKLENLPFEVLDRERDRIEYADQDVLNLAFCGKVKFISKRYNFTGKWGEEKDHKPVVIRHFASFSQKPWNCKLTRLSWISYARYLRHSTYSHNFAGFVLKHLRALLYWRYNKNGRQSLDVCGIRVWHGKRKAGTSQRRM